MNGIWNASCTCARDEDADGERDTRDSKARRDPRREYDHVRFISVDVNAGTRKLPVAVEDAAGERRERDEQQVRESPAQHLDREVEPRAIDAKSRREQQHEQRRRDDADRP